MSFAEYGDDGKALNVHGQQAVMDERGVAIVVGAEMQRIACWTSGWIKRVGSCEESAAKWIVGLQCEESDGRVRGVVWSLRSGIRVGTRVLPESPMLGSLTATVSPVIFALYGRTVYQLSESHSLGNYYNVFVLSPNPP